MIKDCPKCNKKMWIGRTIVNKHNWYCKDYPHCDIRIPCDKEGILK